MTERFRTPVAPLAHKGMISHITPLLMLGSCFASSVGARLEKRLFDVCVNPFGTLYNPASIESAIERIVSRRQFEPGELIERAGMTHSWDCHSSLSSPCSPQELARALNSLLDSTADFVSRASVAILTFGFNRVYRLADTRAVVANCHKFPPATFTEHTLGVEECTRCISRSIAMLRSLNSGMKIILTVSPVRYTGYGLHTSALGKATLLLACAEAAAATDGVIYFPSYEIMNDDLRDYRFYAPDMKHPSEVAVDYIYDIFAESFFSDSTASLAARAAKLTARLAHRTLLPGSDEERAFAASTAAAASALAAECPELSQRISKLTTP